MEGVDANSVTSEASSEDLDLDFNKLDQQMDLYEKISSGIVPEDEQVTGLCSTIVSNTVEEPVNEDQFDQIQADEESGQADISQTHPLDLVATFSKNVGGRNKAGIWTHFETKKDSKGKVVSNKCKKCLKLVSAKACRMMDHKRKCKGTVKTKSIFDVTVQSIDLPCSSKAKALEFPSNEKMKAGMKNWTIKHDADSVEEMDMDVAKFVFSANLPFDTVKNPFLKKIIHKAMGTNYEPPTPKRIKTTLLDKCYKEARHLQMLDLKGKKVVIVQDGWSTNQNESVISHCLHTGGKSVFFDAVSTGSNRKDASYCAKLLEEAIELSEKTFACIVVGVVTDNCNVMKAMRHQIQNKRKQLMTYGCNAHVFNLFGQDITDEDTVQRVVAIQKYFRNHHFESGTLKQLKGRRPILPATTRWNSQIDCLENYKQNHSKYLEISRMENAGIKKDKGLISAIEDPTLYSRVTELHQLIKPIATNLDRVL